MMQDVPTLQFAAARPVEGRKCGGCVVCCVTPQITDPDLIKPAGKRCVNLIPNDGGCACHGIRPRTCREFFCGWRLMPGLGDEWRPDLSGVMITAPGGEVPMDMVAAGAIKVVLLREAAASWVPLVKLIMERVAQDIPIYVTVGGEEGQASYVGFINLECGDDAKAGDIARVAETLKTAWREISGMMAAT